MSIDIRMPALSPTMEKGTLARWLVTEGDTVRAGDLIAEIETDKATMEVEATDDGRVGRFVVGEGTADVPVGDVIAVLLADGEEADAPAPKASVAPKPEPEPQIQSAPATNGDGRGAASPLARRIAEQSRIDITTVKGSGPGGRVLKRDLADKAPLKTADAAPVAQSPRAPETAPRYDPPAGVPHEEVRLSSMRKVIAERMVESKSSIPHFYMSVDVTLDRLIELRREMNARENLSLSLNDFFIHALGVALRRVPDANVQFGGDRLYRFSRADVSVAVAVDGGLVTPVIRDAGGKGLAAIAAEMKALADKARNGQLTPEEYQGGTISLSNLGMFGVRQFDGVINPPQGAIIAVGAGEERAVVRNGAVEIATRMTATLSCDHRAMDGAIGARLLTTFRDLVEEPIRLLL